MLPQVAMTAVIGMDLAGRSRASTRPLRAGARRPRHARAPMRTLLLVLLLFLTKVRKASALHDRRTFAEIGEALLLDPTKVRGGLSISKTRRIHAAAIAMEDASARAHAKDGFRYESAYRRATRVWSYNCQMLNANRLELWGPEWRSDFVMLQGTQRTYSSDRGELAIQQTTLEYHDAIEGRVAKKM